MLLQAYFNPVAVNDPVLKRGIVVDGQELHPDFYIQAIGVYLEHWGSDELTYLKNRKIKEEIYVKHNVKYIFTDESDVDNIYDKLKVELSKCGINKTEWK